MSDRKNQICESCYKICSTNLDRAKLLEMINEEKSTSTEYIGGASSNSSVHCLGRSSESGNSDNTSASINSTNDARESKPWYKRSLSDGSYLLMTTKSLDKPPPVLPVVKASTEGCDLISLYTVAQLIRGEYERMNVNYTIIDCRYPFEYEAGHIKDAVNLYTCSDLIKEVFINAPAVSFGKDQLLLNLGPQVEKMLQGENEDVEMPAVRNFKIVELSKDLELDKMLNELSKAGKSADDEYVPRVPVPEENPGMPPSHVLIFYCEFSSHRSPELCRFLRSVDRIINYPCYPFLFYPHIYVMMGGYEAFYREYPELCEPRAYLRMFQHPNRDEILYYVKLAKEVADVCTACFKASQLLIFKISSLVETKKNKEKPALRLSKSMLHGSQLENMKESLGNSFGNNNDEEIKLSEPEEEFPLSQRLRLVEHIIRKGSYVTNIFERSRNLTREESSSDFANISTIPEGEIGLNARLNFSDANDETFNSSRGL
nr:hypothetical transcript [Hymenolepis microstoma]